jgi:hypothetical protein
MNGHGEPDQFAIYGTICINSLLIRHIWRIMWHHSLMMDTHSLGEFCKSARKAAGLTLAQLSARTGIPTRSLVRIEAGEPQAPIGRVMLVLQSLGYGLEAVPITRPSLASLATLYDESADENNAAAATPAHKR